MPSNGITADFLSVTAMYTKFARVFENKLFLGIFWTSECALIPRCWNRIKYKGTKQKYKVR